MLLRSFFVLTKKIKSPPPCWGKLQKKFLSRRTKAHQQEVRVLARWARACKEEQYGKTGRYSAVCMGEALSVSQDRKLAGEVKGALKSWGKSKEKGREKKKIPEKTRAGLT